MVYFQLESSVIGVVNVWSIQTQFDHNLLQLTQCVLTVPRNPLGDRDSVYLQEDDEVNEIRTG